MAQLEASQAEAKRRFVLCRFDVKRPKMSTPRPKNLERLKMLLQQADQLQCNLRSNSARPDKSRCLRQKAMISRDLKVQIVYLTNQLELAVADLEVEAK